MGKKKKDLLMEYTNAVLDKTFSKKKKSGKGTIPGHKKHKKGNGENNGQTNRYTVNTFRHTV